MKPHVILLFPLRFLFRHLLLCFDPQRSDSCKLHLLGFLTLFSLLSSSGWEALAAVWMEGKAFATSLWVLRLGFPVVAEWFRLHPPDQLMAQLPPGSPASPHSFLPPPPSSHLSKGWRCWLALLPCFFSPLGTLSGVPTRFILLSYSE